MEFHVEASQYDIVPANDEDRSRAGEALAALAHPRLTGTVGAEEVGAELRRRFEHAGYGVTELPFTFSSFPGLYGVSVAGVVFLLGVAVALPFLWRGAGVPALLTLVVLALVLIGIVRHAPTAVARSRWKRTDGVNWLFHRPGARPRYLVVAHRDSKSQPISTLWRTLAISGALLSWFALLLLAIAVVLNSELHPVLPLFVIGWIALTSGVLLAICRVGNHSPGARDNASGLATLLGVAERERDKDDVAFLVTDAEELMLAGAVAVARQIPPVEGVINLDIVDDAGDFSVVERFGFPKRRGTAPHLSAALMTAAQALDLSAHRRDVPFGVMVDHMAFADAGLPAVTLNRSTFATFRRVHRPSDDMHGMNGSGAAHATALISGALAILRKRSSR